MSAQRTNYALAGAALFNPMAAVYWLDVARGRRPGLGLALVGAAGAACAALAVPRARPARAVGAGLLAAAAAAAAGLALDRYVAWVEGRAAPPAPPDARALLLPAAAVCAGAVGAVALAGQEPVALAPHSGRPGDYRWIAAAPHPAARPTAWAGYLLHQLAIWGCVYAAQRARPPYADGMRPVNWVALAVNAAGAALHYAQTRRYYDGLALDVPEGSSLGSAAFLLMLTMALEAPRRGLLLGMRRPALPPELTRFARRYHGYIFSWATVYTFWYHPLEPRPSHLSGTFHMLLLFVQSSLLFTRAHRDPRWTLALELLVLPHALLTTRQNRSGYGPMFTFGFLGMFVLAQMHGLGLSRRARLAIGSAYGAAALAYYGGRRELRRLPDVLRVPALEYGVVTVLALIALLMRALRRAAGR
ncbi:MAG TPA: hypothetical protein PKD53_10530 [Chloroflexaceae bacterium]|nr:hypothetical protein [Chloroflexaceae bacterium]